MGPAPRPDPFGGTRRSGPFWLWRRKMKTRGTLVLALALWASGCDQEPQATDKVTLEWSAGELFYVGATYKVATVKTIETPEALEEDREPDFGENWTEEL